MRRTPVTLIVLVAVGIGFPAWAAPITFHFEGTVTEVFDEDAGSRFLDGSVTAGTLFTGTYSFDSDTPDSSTDPLEGQYVIPHPDGIRVDVGNYVFQTDPPSS